MSDEWEGQLEHWWVELSGFDAACGQASPAAAAAAAAAVAAVLFVAARSQPVHCLETETCRGEVQETWAAGDTLHLDEAEHLRPPSLHECNRVNP